MPKKRERSFHTLEIIPRKFRSFLVLPRSSRTAKRNEKPCRESCLRSDHLFHRAASVFPGVRRSFLRACFSSLPLQGSRVRWLAPTLPFGRGPSPPCIPQKQRRKGGSVFLFQGPSIVQSPLQKPANCLRPGLEPVFETETVISPSVEEYESFQPGRRGNPSPEKKVRFPDSRLNISK